MKLHSTVLALILGVFVICLYERRTAKHNPKRERRLSPTSYSVGDFIISVDPQAKHIQAVNVADTQKTLWESVDPFLRSANGVFTISEGVYRVKDTLSAETNRLTIDTVTPGTRPSGESTLVVGGELQRWEWRLLAFRDVQTVTLRYQLEFQTVAASPSHLRFVASVLDTNGSASATHDRIFLKYRTNPQENFFGFGEQSTHLNMKGYSPTIVTSEQGILRGASDTFFSHLASKFLYFVGAAGEYDSSYKPAPQYITDQGRGLFLENYEISQFDLTQRNFVTVKVLAGEMRGRILYGDSPLALIRSYTEYAGRMARLPDWINSGAIVGMQGGTAVVREIWSKLQARTTPIAAFWLQDWVGQRTSFAGQQLWWNFILNENHYPGWSQLVSDLEAAGSRMMTYCSPFLSDLSNAAEYDGSNRLLFTEARDQGFLVKEKDGSPVLIPNTDFSAGLVDLSNPAAFEWYKGIIRENLIGAGASGYMADFGEALPFEAVLENGETPETYHNRYPEEWARLNKEAVAEAGRTGDVVFFTRSGFTRSPAFSTLMWSGDQSTTWDDRDGLKSAITSLLSSGMSGMSLNHNDIGGYTNILHIVTRSKELFQRWTEMNAFTAVFRTHEGVGPANNHQFYSDDDTLDFFARFSKVYASLAFYRKDLMIEAETMGYPIVRHLMLQYPNDPVAVQSRYQWMLGSEILVAPVTNSGQQYVRVYLPQGSWIHAFTGDTHISGWNVVYAPIGTPAVFYKTGSAVGARFVDNLRSWNVIQ